MIQYLTDTQKNFSLRGFSRKAGFASPNYLRLVADGKKNLTTSSLTRFSRALGLSEREHDAFESLVMLGQAKTDHERNRYYERLRRMKRSSREAKRLEIAQFDAYSHWYVLPVREMLLLGDFVEDPAWIAARLHPRIRESEAKQALQILQDVGLAVRNDEGKLVPAEKKLTTPKNLRSLAFRNYHRSMLKLAGRALDALPADRRHCSSLTMCLSQAKYEKLCERIDRFREDLLDIFEDDSPEREESKEVFLVGFQVVPLSEEVSK
jgi:uncharacterized protein (TIGR02147 family)